MPRALRPVPSVLTQCLVAALLLVLGGAPGLAQDTRIDDVLFASDLDRPSDLEFSADGRLFFIEQPGTVKVFPTLTTTVPVVVADLRSDVGVSIDAGMHGLAVHPSFPAEPYLYISYAIAGGLDPAGRLVRLTIDPATNLEIPGARITLLEGWCRRSVSDGIRALDDVVFGPDGALYVSAGDWGDTGDYTGSGACPDPVGSGGAFRSQDRATPGDPFDFNGSVIRVDPASGAPMPGNPLEGSADASLRYVIADGLRSPFRMTSQPGTESLWIGDVGEGSYEEINKIEDVNDAVVENFGHPCFEGTEPHAPGQAANPAICGSITPTPPVMDYAHGQQAFIGDACSPGVGGSSVSALGFYPGGDYPAEYVGALFIGDYSRNCIWAMLPDAFGNPDPTNMVTVVDAAAGPADLVAGPDGDMFYSDVAGGAIRRLEANSNEPPPPPDGPVNIALGKPAQQSSNWDSLGPERAVDGLLDGAEQQVSHTKNDPQAWWQVDLQEVVDIDEIVLWNRTDCCQDRLSNFHVLVSDTPFSSFDLQATINQPGVTDFPFPGAAGRETRFAIQRSGRYVRVQLAGTNFLQLAEVEVLYEPGGSADPPAVSIDSPTSAFTWVTGSAIAFAGSAVSSTGTPLPPSALDWAVLLNHCIGSISTCHQHQVDAINGAASGSVLGPDHGYPASVELRLTATDPETGASAATSVTLQPQTVILTFDGSPPGIELLAGESSELETTPFTKEFIIGSTATMIAPIEQSLGGTDFSFESWSDGGARVHSVPAPSAPTTFTATYASQAPTNQPPVPVSPGPQSGVEGDVVSLLIAATDGDEDPLVFSAGGLPAGLSIDPISGEISGTLAAGSAGPYSATVSVSDGLEIVDVVFAWTVTAPANQDPTADPQLLTTAFETALPVVLTGSDPDLDPLTFAIVTPPTNGTLAGTAPNVTYTPNAAYAGPDSFTFSVDDGQGGVAQAVISITVGAAPNQDPTADPQLLTTAFETALPVVLTGSDPDLDPLTFAIVTPPTNGALTGTAPNLTYTPNAAYVGPDSFTFSVDDGQGGVAQAVISITVGAAPNQDPTADPQLLTTAFETALPIVLTGSDPDLDSLTFAIVTPPTNGTLAGTAPNVTYTPNAAYAGPDSFTFSVDDGQGGVAQAVISITVGAAPNQDPTADPQLLTTAFETALPVVLTGTDPDLDPLTFAIVTPPTKGALTGTAPNVTYTPNAAYAGPDSFTFSVDDGQGGVAQAVISIMVQPGGPTVVPPTAEGVVLPAVSDQWQTVGLSKTYVSPVVVCTPEYGAGSPPVLARVRNAGPTSFEVQLARFDTLSAALAPAITRCLVVEEGVYTVAANGIQLEAVKFLSTVTDGRTSWAGESRTYANSYSSPVVVGQVMSANDPNPSAFWARGIIVSFPPSSTRLFVGKNVGEDPNTTRADETIGYIVLESGASAAGSLALEAGVGTGIFGYGSAPPYFIPIAGNPSGAVLSGSSMAGDQGGWPILFGPQAVGAQQLQAAWEEDQAADAERAHVAERVAYVAWTNAPGVNQPPTANPQSIATEFATPAPITLSGSDPDLDALTFAVDTPPLNGSLSGAAPNLIYTPGATFSGADSFTFSVSDGRGGVDQALVSITVGAPNQPPTADPQTLSTPYATPLPITLTGTDADLDPLTFAITAQPSNGVVSGVAPNVIYTPNAAYSGPDSFAFSVADGRGGVDQAVVQITVGPAPPVIPPLAEGVVVPGVTDQWRTVSLLNAYVSPVIVCTPEYGAGSPPAVARVRNAGTSSFELRLGRFDGSTAALPGAVTRCFVVEEGVYSEQLNGVDLEAVRFTSTVTGRAASWIGEARSYANTYVSPIVLGQVMTANDPNPSAFWSRGPNLSTPPSPTVLRVGKNIAEDSNIVRADETIGYIVLEAGVSAVGGLTIEAGRQSGVLGFDNSPPFVAALTGSPTGAVLSGATMAGGNGGWPVLYGPAAVAPQQLRLAWDEDQIRDAERSHIAEWAAYLAWTNPAGANQAPTANPQAVAAVYQTPVAITLTGSDPDLDPLTFSVTVPPANGSLSGVAPALTYTPNALFSGADAFTFSVDDGRGGVSQAVVSITVQAPNQPPVASPQTLTTPFATALPITLTGTDADLDPLTFAIVSQPTNGALSGVAPNVVYTPDSSYSGPDAFTFSVDDGRGGVSQATISITVEPAPPSSLKAEFVQVSGISSTQWLAVTLTKTYTSPVVVCSPVYSAADPSAVVRMRNAASNGFEVRAERLDAGASPIAAMSAQCLAVEEGVYTAASDGVTLEAVRYLSTTTSSPGSWAGEVHSYANTYTNPVVVGQVMSANDPAWSTFWASGSLWYTPPNSGTLKTGKHVAEDPNRTRAAETIGFLVVEARSGLLDGVSFAAGVGPASVLGRTNGPPFSYTVPLANPAGGVVSTAGMLGDNGGWPVLLAPTPFSPNTLQLMFDEDQLLDSEQGHVAERVAYIVFSGP